MKTLWTQIPRHSSTPSRSARENVERAGEHHNVRGVGRRGSPRARQVEGRTGQQLDARRAEQTLDQIRVALLTVRPTLVRVREEVRIVVASQLHASWRPGKR